MSLDTIKTQLEAEWAKGPKSPPVEDFHAMEHLYPIKDSKIYIANSVLDDVVDYVTAPGLNKPIKEGDLGFSWWDKERSLIYPTPKAYGRLGSVFLAPFDDYFVEWDRGPVRFACRVNHITPFKGHESLKLLHLGGHDYTDALYDNDGFYTVTMWRRDNGVIRRLRVKGAIFKGVGSSLFHRRQGNDWDKILGRIPASQTSAAPVEIPRRKLNLPKGVFFDYEGNRIKYTAPEDELDGRRALGVVLGFTRLLNIKNVATEIITPTPKQLREHARSNRSGKPQEYRTLTIYAPQRVYKPGDENEVASRDRKKVSPHDRRAHERTLSSGSVVFVRSTTVGLRVGKQGKTPPTVVRKYRPKGKLVPQITDPLLNVE